MRVDNPKWSWNTNSDNTNARVESRMNKIKVPKMKLQIIMANATKVELYTSAK